MSATDDLERTAGTLEGRPGIGSGERPTPSAETTAGENDLGGVIDTGGVGTDVVQPGPGDEGDALARSVGEFPTTVTGKVQRRKLKDRDGAFARSGYRFRSGYYPTTDGTTIRR